MRRQDCDLLFPTDYVNNNQEIYKQLGTQQLTPKRKTSYADVLHVTFIVLWKACLVNRITQYSDVTTLFFCLFFSLLINKIGGIKTCLRWCDSGHLCGQGFSLTHSFNLRRSSEPGMITMAPPPFLYDQPSVFTISRSEWNKTINLVKTREQKCHEIDL